jgi:3-oxoadipate enol-lactonase
VGGEPAEGLGHVRQDADAAVDVVRGQACGDLPQDRPLPGLDLVDGRLPGVGEVEQPGPARSSTAAGDFRYDEDLHELLDALGLRRPALVGISLGARTAVEFALTWPDRARALVLAGPGLSGMEFTDPFVLSQFAAQQAAVEAWDADAFVEAVLRYGVDGPHRQPGETDPEVRTRCHDMAMATVLAHATAKGTWIERDALDRLEELRAPTLAIVGELDFSDIHRMVDEVARRVPGAERRAVAGAGHMVNLERPAEFTATVLDFLDRTAA